MGLGYTSQMNYPHNFQFVGLYTLFGGWVFILIIKFALLINKAFPTQAPYGVPLSEMSFALASTLPMGIVF